jgi:hypothetical protein
VFEARTSHPIWEQSDLNTERRNTILCELSFRSPTSLLLSSTAPPMHQTNLKRSTLFPTELKTSRVCRVAAPCQQESQKYIGSEGQPAKASDRKRPLSSRAQTWLVQLSYQLNTIHNVSIRITKHKNAMHHIPYWYHNELPPSHQTLRLVHRSNTNK